MEARYLLARLTHTRDQLQEHLDEYVTQDGEKSPDYLRGYVAGKTIGLGRALLLIERLRAEVGAEITRQG